MNKVCITDAIAIFGCLLDMPYGYYMVVRIFTMVLAGYLAYKFFDENMNRFGLVAVVVAILFQPFP